MSVVNDSSPHVRYTQDEGGVRIAFTSMGRGPAVVEVPHIQMCHMLAEWHLPAVRNWCRSVARRHRLIRFDNSGSGLSDERTRGFALEPIADEIGIVADAVGLERFTLFGRITGGLAAIVFAARHPERVTELILWNSFADHRRHGGQARMKAVLDLAATDWQLFTESISQAALGWQDGPTARAWAEVLRAASSQEIFLQYLDARAKWDVTHLLGSIRARTLVMYDLNNQLVEAERNHELAAAIPDARLAAVQSDGGMPGDDAMEVIDAFLGSVESPPEALPELTRRENEVVAILITGASNQKIAQSLSISVHTVTRHLTNIFDKLGVTSRSQAIARVFAASDERIP